MNNMTYLVLFWVYRTDIDRLIDQILLEEPLISESRKPALKKLIESKLFVVVNIKILRIHCLFFGIIICLMQTIDPKQVIKEIYQSVELTKQGRNWLGLI